VKDRRYWLAWSQISGVGAVLLKRIQQQFGQLSIAWEVSPEELQAIEGIGPKLSQSIGLQRREIHPDELFAAYTDDNLQFITPADPEYPRLLWEIADPPVLLHYRGNLGLLESIDRGQAVAMVGTRHMTDYGGRWTKRLSHSLSQHGVTIVSGLAAGVDTAAHQSCLEAGGQTIAVLGTGVDLVYPMANRKLHQRISETGLILSEYADGTPADRRHFPARNRIVAGLARTTLVLEAGLTSGALITARLANDYGRDVYALAGSLDNPDAAGCLKLISQGAQIITSEQSLLESLGATANLQQLDLFNASREISTHPSASVEIAVPEHLQLIWQVITSHSAPIVLDVIVDRTGLATGDALSQLLELELMGAIKQDAGMRYECATL
jgi:DNA processing protein